MSADPGGGVVLRPVGEDDRPVLFAIYASTRSEEMAAVPWSSEQKRAFLQMQFDAQDRHYRTHYPGATLDLIVDEAGQALGRLYVYRSAEEIRIVDIAVLPPSRGRGIGTRLLHDLFAEARAASLPLTIHVEAMNPARRLYERLGFRLVKERPPYLLMRWTPEPVS